MFKKSQVCTAVLLALGGGTGAFAQDAGQRVEVTGSAIKRIDAESALPIQVINAADIAKSGANSVTELIQKLPSMQNFTTSSQSVNGGGGGGTSASLHALGSSYTLVLLNGRRLAPLVTGSGISVGLSVNLESIPLAAIERVEVLTDGASALYGSDAIAGVLNFITKKDSTAGDFNATAYVPQRSGGSSATASISKGFGNLATDKFNILLAASFDKQKELNANQRKFSKTGIITFDDLGAAQEVDLISSNTVPANVATARLSNGTTITNFNPYLLKTGACPEGQLKAGNRCFFDFAATVQNIPASERSSLYGSGRFQPSNNLSLFTEISWSRFFNEARYAAPAQPGLPVPASLLASSINPYLAKLGFPGLTATAATMNLRLFDAGGRQDQYKTDSLHFVVGADTTLGSVDLTTAYTHSESKWTDTAQGGYASLNAFNKLIASGTWDPLLSPAGTSVEIVKPIVLKQVLDEAKSTLDTLTARGSTVLGKLPGGSVGVAFGGDLTKQSLSDNPSAILQGANALQPNFTDAIVGGGGGALPFDSSRKSFGLFGEVNLPVIKELEITGSARYDSYEAIKNSKNFDAGGNPIAPATQGEKSSSGTYKLSMRFQPTKELLLRASLGTGFRAPQIAAVTSPLQSFGSSGFHVCPPGLSAAKAASCGPISQEYNVQSGGNPATDSSALKPEKSTQWTMGFRFEPTAAVSVGADLWNVSLKDQINNVSENTAFGNGAQYDSLFKVLPDPITGTPTLTFLSVPVNTGKAKYRGIDLDAQSKFKTPVGDLSAQIRGTYMMRADYQTPGTAGYISSMSKVGPDTQVTFRYLISASATLTTGAFSNTLGFRFAPGYMDDTFDYCRTDANGNCLKTPGGDDQGRYVSSYMVWNWQGKYEVNKALSVTVGVKNLFDRDPPFSLLDQNGTGNARGFDGRYTDPIGRQFYLTGAYRF